VTRRIVQPQGAAVREQTVTLRDDSLKQLVSYFPGLDAVPSEVRDPVATWPPAMIIRFARADGTSLPVAINWDYTQWAAGGTARGSIGAGFKQFISEQFVSGP
jgi:hypothetical protein